MVKKYTLFFLFMLFSFSSLYSQCGSGTPVFIVDLSDNPNETWLSPSIARNDTCCGSDDNCVQFIITLSPLAEGVIFDVVDGALPGGALFYQVDCGPQTEIGESICLSGVGPHSVTFCKPGLNENIYAITSIAEPEAGDDVTLTEGCSRQLTSVGFEPSTIIWSSIYPGSSGDYNYLLDCTLQCDTITVSSAENMPPYVDYQICGFALGLCESIGVCDTVRVFFQDSLDVSIAPINPMVCYGDAVTSITAMPSGGVPPYYYQWSTGESSASIDVADGFYTVQVSDSGGCYPQSTSVTVGAFLAAISADAGPDQFICNQNPNVQLNGSVFGVNTGVWNGGLGSFSPDRNALNAQYMPSSEEINTGFVELTLLTTNTSNCLPDSDLVRINFTAFIGDPSFISDSVSCFDYSDGYAEVQITNGFLNYSYLWDDASASTSSFISNQAAGTYSVVITDSLGCDTSVSLSIEQPDPLVIFAFNAFDVDCFGDSSGQATVYASGGNNYYTYNWGAEANFQTSQTATNLGANIYYPVVQDLKGCTADTSITIDQAAELNVFIDSIEPINCYDDSTGEITVMASGGTGPYLYAWDLNAGLQVGPTATNLSSGSYQVIIVDAKACQDTLNITLDQPEELLVNAVVLQNVLCFGDSTGSAEISVNGGIQPYSILWDDAAQNQTTPIASNLPGGLISVLVSDSNNCQSLQQVTIEAPDSALILIGSQENADCFGNNNGQAGVEVSGGTAPYSYLWSANANGQTTSQLTNLVPGQYWLWVNDSQNCSDSISFNITEPPVLQVQSSSTAVICHGDSNGTASLNVTGGSPPYAYQWSAPYTQTGPMIFDLPSGSINYLVSDINSCQDSGIVSITSPDPILIQVSNDQEVCADDVVEISAIASGGTGNLIYFWNGLGAGATQSFVAYQSAVYVVQAVDSLGCSSPIDSVQIDVKNIYLDSLSVTNTGAICVGESSLVQAAFTGQDPIYTYSWSNGLGSTFGPIQVSPLDSTWYVFTVTDECNNSLADSSLVPVYPNPDIDLNLSEIEGCEPLEVAFSNSTNQSNYNYIWLFGDGGASTEADPVYTYQNSGQFLVELQIFSQFGCSASSANNTYVNVLEAPSSSFTASPQITDIASPSIQFTNTSSSDAIFFTWSFGDGDSIMIENPEHSYSDVGVFEVILETENLDGCVSRVSRDITINPTHDIVIPTAFTPNLNGPESGYYDPADLSNNIFYPFAEYVGEFSMLIFNRWGELIFESDNIMYGWDGYYKGKLSSTGTYVYKIDIVFIDGYTEAIQGIINIVN